MEERILISDQFDPAGKREVVEFLKGYVTPHKQELIEKVLNQRTRLITLVMEDIFKPHNASANPVPVARPSATEGIRLLREAKISARAGVVWRPLLVLIFHRWCRSAGLTSSFLRRTT